MLRALSGPYRSAFFAMVAVCGLIGIGLLTFVRLPVITASLSVSVFMLPVSYYFIFRTGSAHLERVRGHSTWLDIVLPFITIFAYGAVFGVGFLAADESGQVDGLLGLVLLPLMVMAICALIGPYLIAGRKLTELRGGQPNPFATIGWALVHFYWIIGFYWLLTSTRPQPSEQS